MAPKLSLLFKFNENAAPMPDAYYRLMWSGN
jgi:hypothetical protein